MKRFLVGCVICSAMLLQLWYGTAVYISVRDYLAEQDVRTAVVNGEDEVEARKYFQAYWAGRLAKHPELVDEVEDDKKQRSKK